MVGADSSEQFFSKSDKKNLTIGKRRLRCSNGPYWTPLQGSTPPDIQKIRILLVELLEEEVFFSVDIFRGVY